MKRKLPAAIREWYELEGAVDLLRKYSNDDHPVEVASLGLPIEEWYGAGRRDFVDRDGLLLLMTENQGVCAWAARLDLSDDPAVLVEVDTAPNEVWLPYADRFSTFLYCQIWDHSGGAMEVQAQAKPLSDDDLRFLRHRLDEGPQTACWPGNANYRFESALGRILLWNSDAQCDCFLRATSCEALLDLIKTVWDCADLKQSLWGTTAETDGLLKTLRLQM